MNRKPVFLLILVLLIILGCAKTAQNAQDPEQNQIEKEENIDPAGYSSLGVFVVEGSLSELKDDGKMYWKASANAGDTVEWTGEKTDAVRSYDGAARTFYKVYFNGQELWVQDYYIAGPAVPAVIVNDDTVLYTKPNLSSVARTGTVTLPKYSIVGMLHDEDLADDFIPIAAFLNLSVPGERWVRIKDISWDANDTGSVKLARVAAVTKNAAAHKELLKNAMEMAENGKMFGGVPGSVNYDPGLFELTVTNNLEIPEDGWNRYFALEDSVNVRDLPSINGNLVRKMEQYESVIIVAKSKTAEKIKVDDQEISGVWFRIEDGNWVFSHFMGRELQ